MIERLNENEVFVFGSNMIGFHGAGAALQAKEKFGAQNGIAEGMTGQCYAFPTLNEEFGKRTDEEWSSSVQKLYRCVIENPDKKFLLTKVGCGIAGYDEEWVKQCFLYDCPKNIIKPEGW